MLLHLGNRLPTILHTSVLRAKLSRGQQHQQQAIRYPYRSTALSQRIGKRGNGSKISLLFDFMRSTAASLAWHAMRDWKKKKTKRKRRLAEGEGGRGSKSNNHRAHCERSLKVSHTKVFPSTDPQFFLCSKPKR